jgi:hypothetical protein
VSTLGERLVARIEGASLEELARAAFLVDDGDAVAEGDAERVIAALSAAVGRKNQFAASEPRLAQGIEREIDALFDGIGGGRPRAELFARHVASLGALFREILGEEPREVTSATYSPELQLKVLGLAVDALREPILDVGCGEDAALVRFLRARGKDARGIDHRVGAAGTDVATQADWLTHEYGASRWGTIVSHLGFTLHFMHQEMKRSDLAFEYARAYMRIVRSLAPGGTFAYVPGVPFIESMLPAPQHVVGRVALAPDLVTDAVKRVQEVTGLVLDAATHVTRR